jgi:tripartite-type tricarboxylate transporter receptor subunit TctC
VNADTNAVLNSTDLVAALAQQGAQPAGGTPQQFEKFMESEVAKWRHVIVKAKIPLAN